MAEEPPISVEAGEVQAHPKRTGHSRVDLILALTAIFLSLVSLVVAIEHGKTQRDLVAASTWPYIGITLSNGANEYGDVVIGLGNEGVGPAKLQSFEIFYHGKPVRSGIDLLRRCCGLPADLKQAGPMINGRLSYSVAEDIVLRAGENTQVLTLRPDPEHPELARRFASALGEFTFRGCYCSVLDECWMSDLSSTRVTKVKRCPVPEHPFDPTGR